MFACENTIIEFLPFSTFDWCHLYTGAKTTVLHYHLLFYYHCSFRFFRMMSGFISFNNSTAKNRIRRKDRGSLIHAAL